MIKKIDIASYGLFQDFSWLGSIGANAEFKQYNIIYGRNYSGKTTLSRILHSLETRQPNSDYENGNFAITLSDGTIVTAAELSSFPDSLKVRVFNEDFIKANLNWFHRRDGTIEPFTVLGAENVDLEQKIRDLKTQLGSTESKTGIQDQLASAKLEESEAQQKLDTMKSSLDNELRDKARSIKEDATIFAIPTYQITSIRADLGNVDDDLILSSPDRDEREGLIRDVTLSTLNEPWDLSLQFDQLLAKTAFLLTKVITPTSEIEELATNARLQEWARDGIGLHRNAHENCGFCRNRIDDSRWIDLDGHFNRDSEDLRSQIDGSLKLIGAERNGIKSSITFTRDQFYSTRQPQFDSLINQWWEAVKSYEQSLDALETSLLARKSDIFKTFDTPEVIDNSLILIELHTKLRALLRENNEITGSLGIRQKTAREELRLSEVAAFAKVIGFSQKRDEIADLEQQLPTLRSKTLRFDEQRKNIENGIRTLEEQLKDAGHGAELVNEYLREHFGHAGLRLVSINDGTKTRFSIHRGGAEAKNLSTGETSLIGFCYFMARLRDELSDDLIVYIDDPISSLDSGHIYFIFSMIRSHLCEAGRCRQLFISTHNFDFLKYLTSLRKVAVVQNQLGFFLAERWMKQTDPRCTLRIMPKYLSKFVSEFNYLFSEIHGFYADGSGSNIEDINSSYNTFYNLPNNLRKFLEFYLFYKFPNNSGLNNLNKLFAEQDAAFVNRIINEGSHLNFVDRGWHPFDIPEMERCVKIVIDKIKEKDEVQYNELVASLD